MHSIHTNQYVTITELKTETNTIVSKAKLGAIAVLSHNKPKLYLLSPEEYEAYNRLKEDEVIYQRMQRMQAGHKKVINPDQLEGE